MENEERDKWLGTLEIVAVRRLAGRLGFSVLRVQPGFPDCEALREDADGRWRRVRIEFEFESRNFLLHGHDKNGCDLIVCWKDNWKGCPLEVIELGAMLTPTTETQRHGER